MSLLKIFFFLFVVNIYSQVKPSILKSALTSVGASSVPVFDHKYVVRQSIGQDGIVGKANLNVASIQQDLQITNHKEALNKLIKEVEKAEDVIYSLQ